MNVIVKSKEDKINYLKGLIRVAKCNGVVEPEEIEFFKLIANGFELSEETQKNLYDCFNTNEPITLSFSTRYISVFFIQEAVQLCMVDGSFDETEQQEISLIADELDIEQADTDKIIAWVAEGLEWRRRGEKLVSEIAKEM